MSIKGDSKFSFSKPLARRLPFFYGWVIAIVAGLVSLAGVAESPAMLGIFITDMSSELGWSRTEISGAVLLGTALVFIAAPVSGKLTDVWSPRYVICIGASITAICLMAIGSVTSIFFFYILLSISYAMNAGIARVAVNALVAKWFVSSRGKATGVVSMFLGLGFLIMPIIAATVTDEFGWRAGWRVLGALTLVLAVPVSFFLLRSVPEDVNQKVDGYKNSKNGEDPPADLEQQWSTKEAIRTPTFWMLLISLSTIAVAILGFAVHLVPHLEDRGIDTKIAALSFSVAGAIMLPSSPAWGWFLDRFPARLGFLVAALVVVIFTLLTLLAHSAFMVIPIGISMGIGFGGFGMVQRVIYANYFGRQSAGTVLGMAVPLMAIAQGLGTVIAGAAFDIFGDYIAVFSLFAVLVVISIGVMYKVSPPTRV